MADDLKTEIDQLKRETAELSGLALATGVILTQLLQSMLQRELNPQNAATRVMTNARQAIEGFASHPGVDPVTKARALEADRQLPLVDDLFIQIFPARMTLGQWVSSLTLLAREVFPSIRERNPASRVQAAAPRPGKDHICASAAKA